MALIGCSQFLIKCYCADSLPYTNSISFLTWSFKVQLMMVNVMLNFQCCHDQELCQINENLLCQIY